MEDRICPRDGTPVVSYDFTRLLDVDLVVEAQNEEL